MPSMTPLPTLSQQTQALRHRLNALQIDRGELHQIRKEAFLAAPPMPQGQTPPTDPSAGAPPPQGGPPAAGGAPPMDPAMAGGVDPAAAGAADPTVSGGGGAPPMNPDILEEILGTLESMAPVIQQVQQKQQEQDQQIQDLLQQVMQLDATISAQPSQPAAGAAPAQADPMAQQQPQGGAW